MPFEAQSLSKRTWQFQMSNIWHSNANCMQWHRVTGASTKQCIHSYRLVWRQYMVYICRELAIAIRTKHEWLMYIRCVSGTPSLFSKPEADLVSQKRGIVYSRTERSNNAWQERVCFPMHNIVCQISARLVCECVEAHNIRKDCPGAGRTGAQTIWDNPNNNVCWRICVIGCTT